MRISRASLFFFILGFNYIFLRMIIFPQFYDSYGANGLIYINILQTVITLLFLLIPKKYYQNNYFNKYKNTKIKYIYNIILILRIIIGIGIGCYALHVLFFYNQPFVLLPMGIIITILLISSIKPSEVIQISTLFGIAIILTYFLYLYNYIELDFSLIFKNYHYKFEWSFVIFSLCLIFDNLNYFIVDKDNMKFDKKTVVGALSIVMLLFMIEYGILTLSSGDKLFEGYPLVGFTALSIEPVSRYNGNFDYIYVLMIVITAVFKYSYFLSIIRNSIKKEFKRKAYIFMSLFLFSGVMLVYWLYGININIVKGIVIGLFLLSSIVLLWMFKENIYARKIQK